VAEREEAEKTVGGNGGPIEGGVTRGLTAN
jgi:hypothetical protein